ncbi:hypothetical protein DAC16_118 [Bacteroides phage DAC16]|nr:hypothetical protein DAC16_118 [Bacteroides phage DAC16]
MKRLTNFNNNLKIFVINLFTFVKNKEIKYKLKMELFL